MGTTSCFFNSKEEFITDVNKLSENEKVKIEVLKHKVVGKCVWQLCEHTNKTTSVVEKFIGVVVFSTIKKYGRTEYYWKEMSHCMHPYYYTCPLGYLDHVNFNSESSLEWKKGVENYHAEQKAKLAIEKPMIGQTWTIVGATIKGSVKLLKKEARSFIGVHVETGKIYKFSNKWLGAQITG